MQKVIKTVYTNLCDLKLAIDGTIVMSQYLRDSLDAMYDARIPERWQKVKFIFNYIFGFFHGDSKYCGVGGAAYARRCSQKISFIIADFH